MNQKTLFWLFVITSSAVLQTLPAQARGFAKLESDKQKGACADQILGSNETCIDLGTIGGAPAPKPCTTSTSDPNDPTNCANRKPANKKP